VSPGVDDFLAFLSERSRSIIHDEVAGRPIVLVDASYCEGFTDDVLERMSGYSEFSEIDALFLRESGVTDRGMPFIRRFPRLEFLDFGGTRIGDASAIHIRGCALLDTLHVENTRLGDLGVSLLAELPLCELNLKGTAVTDEGCRHLARCDQLVNLFLQGCAVSNASIATFAAIKTLRLINVVNTAIDQEGAQEFRRLRSDVELTWG
jgi:hypothetical protein